MIKTLSKAQCFIKQHLINHIKLEKYIKISNLLTSATSVALLRLKLPKLFAAYLQFGVGNILLRF